MRRVKSVLIGGTSHVGKTTVGERMAEALDAELFSTDYVARHPGRPWREDGSEVPAHVIEHFTRLTLEDLKDEVLAHYQRVWKQVEAKLAESNRVLAIEGSSVLPALCKPLLSPEVYGFWLVGDEEVIRTRILGPTSSLALPAEQRQAIDMFAARAIRFNEYVRDEASRLGLRTLQAELSTQSLVGTILDAIQ